VAFRRAGMETANTLPKELRDKYIADMGRNNLAEKIFPNTLDPDDCYIDLNPDAPAWIYSKNLTGGMVAKLVVKGDRKIHMREDRGNLANSSGRIPKYNLDDENKYLKVWTKKEK